jgi:SpoIIAA-like
MLRILSHMPPGTVGVEAVGTVTEDDYRQVLAPALADALQRREVRLLYVLGEEFDSFSRGAAWADTKLWAKNLKDWERVAVVSDADWLEHAVSVFGWLVPGQVRVFETDEVDEAKAWLVGIDVDDD